jgi:hypothetical protein
LKIFELAKSLVRGTVTLFAAIRKHAGSGEEQDRHVFESSRTLIWGSTTRAWLIRPDERGRSAALQRDEWEARLNSPPCGSEGTARSASTRGDLFANYAGRASDMKAFCRCADQPRSRSRLRILRAPGSTCIRQADYADILRHKEVSGGPFQARLTERLRAAIMTPQAGCALTHRWRIGRLADWQIG